tara:strand:- start:813 stop:1169 length:357 start_codon:yes stop_codon:yes gene_type:complete
MKNIKKISLYILLNLLLTSCGGSDVIVKIYGAFEYNCTKDEFRTLAETPMLAHLKKNKWYTREEHHNAYVEKALEPYKDMPMSEETLAKITPTLEMTNGYFNEFIMAVDCENPQDIKY